ncbi:BlaI/MecI/CopY family transcriptional regulator [Hydrogenothermus marinus]|uniref:Putative transcriptional regulator n=1 Tax=Hydrogenothermus marinus TaxID=133270 RepID=A0A3M0BJY4_9AQUI|nr:BlaI/MecI/CopY family transcriptional regulator [Hydrogenothermus marinus]RMA97753.1 putative transcriptional regulator [Hydrogenothermus marinus]
MEFLKKGLKALRFKRNKPSPFGELEEKVMEVVWKKENATVSEVREALKNKFAYTTIMTILDRLYKKGVLKREKEGKGYRYFPVMTKEEFEKSITKEVVKNLTKENPVAAIAAFEGIIENLSQEDIEKLKKFIEQKNER